MTYISSSILNNWEPKLSEGEIIQFTDGIPFYFNKTLGSELV